MSLKTLLDSGRQAAPVMIAPLVSRDDMEFWPHANRYVLWGWKRDDGIQSRVVYYSGCLQACRHGITAEDSFFFYKHRTFTAPATVLAKQLEQGARVVAKTLAEPTLTFCSDRGGRTSTILFAVGVPRIEDRDRVRRLLTRRPRKRLIASSLPPGADHRKSDSVFPADLYAGSGVSYEAGLPTLCNVHAYFCLDDHANGTFAFGARDLLPLRLTEDPVQVIANFCSLHTKAISARPTPAQRVIAALYKRGVIWQVFSDNVDNLLCKVNVPFIRTRGSGVFNERFPARFRSPTLLVVGVAADRRQLIQQARGKHIRIAVVDPCARVSPGVQHLNYLKPRDCFFRCTAHEFFTRLPLESFPLNEVHHDPRAE